MQNDFDSAAWARNHMATSTVIADWIDKLAYVFHRLQELKNSPPWRGTRH